LDFVSTNGQLRLPDAKEINVKAGGDAVPVKAVASGGVCSMLRLKSATCGSAITSISTRSSIDENKRV